MTISSSHQGKFAIQVFFSSSYIIHRCIAMFAMCCVICNTFYEVPSRKEYPVRIRGIVASFSTAFMFGLGAVLTKIATGSVNPFLIACVSLLGGGLLLAIYCLVTQKTLIPSLQRSAWVNVFLLGSVGTAIPQFLTVAGFARTNAITGGFILQLYGLTAIIFALLFLGEKLNWKQMIGIACLLIGSGLVIMRELSGNLLEVFNLGDLLIFGGAIGFGFAFIPAKKLSRHVDTLQLSVLRLVVGGTLLLPTLLFQPETIRVGISLPMIFVLSAYTITNFCIGYITLQEGLRLLEAWESAAIMQTVPLFSTIFALLLLHDPITSTQIIGGIFAIFGGTMVTYLGRTVKGSHSKKDVGLEYDLSENAHR